MTLIDLICSKRPDIAPIKINQEEWNELALKGQLELGHSSLDPWFLNSDRRGRFYKVILLEPELVIESIESDQPGRLYKLISSSAECAGSWQLITASEFLELLSDGLSPEDQLYLKLGYEVNKCGS